MAGLPRKQESGIKLPSIFINDKLVQTTGGDAGPVAKPRGRPRSASVADIRYVPQDGTSGLLKRGQERSVSISSNLPNTFGDDENSTPDRVRFRNVAERSLAYMDQSDGPSEKLLNRLRTRRSTIAVPYTPSSSTGGLGLSSSEGKLDAKAAAAARRVSVASSVGLVVFKKMYNAQLNAHVRKVMEENENPPPPPRTPTPEQDEMWESDESEPEEPPTFPCKPRRKSLPQLTSIGSTEAQLALLKCYDEKLRDGITEEYPQYKSVLYRPKTPSKDFINLELVKDSSTHAKTKSKAPKSDIKGRLLRAGTLLDAIKADKGENVTSPRYKKLQGNVTTSPNKKSARPQSKALIKKYNSWTKSWAKNTSEAKQENNDC